MRSQNQSLEKMLSKNEIIKENLTSLIYESLILDL